VNLLKLVLEETLENFRNGPRDLIFSEFEVL
jgi:hypothetical protein